MISLGCAGRDRRSSAPEMTSIVADASARRCASRVALTTVGGSTVAADDSVKVTMAGAPTLTSNGIALRSEPHALCDDDVAPHGHTDDLKAAVGIGHRTESVPLDND